VPVVATGFLKDCGTGGGGRLTKLVGFRKLGCLVGRLLFEGSLKFWDTGSGGEGALVPWLNWFWLGMLRFIPALQVGRRELDFCTEPPPPPKADFSPKLDLKWQRQAEGRLKLS